jgi:hypothetical protein
MAGDCNLPHSGIFSHPVMASPIRENFSLEEGRPQIILDYKDIIEMIGIMPMKTPRAN